MTNPGSEEMNSDEYRLKYVTGTSNNNVLI